MREIYFAVGLGLPQESMESHRMFFRVECHVFTKDKVKVTFYFALY